MRLFLVLYATASDASLLSLKLPRDPEECRRFIVPRLSELRYRPLLVLRARDPEHVFEVLNSPEYSDLQEALQSRVRELGHTHTSMSALDMCIDLSTWTPYLCPPADWLTLRWEDLPRDVQEQVLQTWYTLMELLGLL